MDLPPDPAGPPHAALLIPGVEDLTPVGHGGFGTVYRGRQAAFDRDVAVKVLSGIADGGSTAAGWRREVAAMGRLSNHPNIVPVYDGGVTDDGVPYLVMPFVPGGTLGDVVQARGPLPAPEVAALAAKLAGALASAHERGVLHRDVKPANVLLSPYGEPQLTDFGIARVDDTTTTGVRTEALALTVAYAAPEVLNGEPATERSDVYSLAATVHFLLTGEAPFVSRSDEPLVALVLRITTQAPPDLRARGVPDALAQVVEAGLAKDPGDRPGDAADLQRRFESAARRLGATDDTVVLPVTAPPSPATAALPATPPPPSPAPPTAAPSVPPGPSVAPAPARTSPRAVPDRAAPAPRRRDGRRVLLAVVGLLVLATAAALLVTRGGDDDPTASDATSTTVLADPAGGDAGSPSTAATDRDADATARSTAGALEATARTYLQTLAAGELDAAFAMLSPAMQRSQPRSSFDSFWGGFQSIQIVGEPRVDEDAAAVTVPVSFDGAREDYRLTFVAGDDDRWLVDGPRPG